MIDSVTHQTTDYCIAGQYSKNQAPTWSPDGRQIAVNGILDNKRQILLVDFAAQIVSLMAEGELVGWMAEK